MTKITLDIDPIYYEKLEQLRFVLADDPSFRRKPTATNIAYEALFIGLEILESKYAGRLERAFPEEPEEPEEKFDIEQWLGYEIPDDTRLLEIHNFAKMVREVAPEVVKPPHKKQRRAYIADIWFYDNESEINQFKAWLYAAYIRGLVHLRPVGPYPTHEREAVKMSELPTPDGIMHMVQI
jgi:hypothetical protein